MPSWLPGVEAGAAWARVTSDPLLGYALLAATILAGASLVGGWARGDARALARPVPWICAALAALASLSLVVAGERIEAAGIDWPLDGLRRLPLYLVALGYGPTLGVVAGVLFAAVESTHHPSNGAEAVLALELAALGWIALAPSPRRTRLAAPLGIVVAWTLATASGGLAALAWAYRPLPAGGILPHLATDLPGVLAAAAVTALFGPSWWRRAAPGAAAGIAGPTSDRADDDTEGRMLHPLERPRRNPRRELEEVRVPAPLPPRPPRSRTLAPPHPPRDAGGPDDPA